MKHALTIAAIAVVSVGGLQVRDNNLKTCIFNEYTYENASLSQALERC